MPSPVPPRSDSPQEPGAPLRPGDVLSLDVDLLDDNPFQPRTQMDPAKLEELAASIAQSGLLQPIAVRPTGPGRYQVVAGHRRVAAFKKLRLEGKSEADRRQYELIRAHVVAAVSDSQMAIAAYVENTARDNLNPLEEAAALTRIRELGGHATASDVAAATGQPERRVRRLLRLATCPLVVKACVSTGLLVEVAEHASEGEEGARTSSRARAGAKERRRLDLIAALEFARLHARHAKKNPDTADDRTTTAMTRALTGNWGLRRIQTYVDGIINNNGPGAEGIGDGHLREEVPHEKGTDDRGASRPSRPQQEQPPQLLGVVAPVLRSSLRDPAEVSSSTSERFTLYLSRLKQASRVQLEAAQTTIDDVRQLIAAQLELKGPSKT